MRRVHPAPRRVILAALRLRQGSPSRPRGAPYVELRDDIVIFAQLLIDALRNADHNGTAMVVGWLTEAVDEIDRLQQTPG